MIHKVILSHREDPKPKAEETRVELPNTMEPGTCLDLAFGGEEHSCDGRL